MFSGFGKLTAQSGSHASPERRANLDKARALVRTFKLMNQLAGKSHSYPAKLALLDGKATSLTLSEIFLEAEQANSYLLKRAGLDGEPRKLQIPDDANNFHEQRLRAFRSALTESEGSSPNSAKMPKGAPRRRSQLSQEEVELVESQHRTGLTREQLMRAGQIARVAGESPTELNIDLIERFEYLDDMLKHKR